MRMTKNYENERRRIGERISELRTMRRVTQVELAKRCGKKQSYISRIELGKHAVGLDLLTDIADALDARVELVRNEKLKDNLNDECF